MIQKHCITCKGIIKAISYKPYCATLQNHSLSQSIMLENLLARHTSFFSFFQKDSESSRFSGSKKSIRCFGVSSVLEFLKKCFVKKSSFFVVMSACKNWSKFQNTPFLLVCGDIKIWINFWELTWWKKVTS